MISQKDYLNLKKAGKISFDSLQKGIDLIHAGTSYYEIAEEIENFIKKSGGTPAFPVNISENDVAAHYTPSKFDKKKIKEGNIYKIDVGAQVSGMIGDNAESIECYTKKYCLLKKSTEEALNCAISSIKEDVSNKKIGSIISSKIKDYGFNPIINLSGHQIKKYNLHSGLTIPNTSNNYFKESILEKGMILAIEPFATNGYGAVYEFGTGNIYSITNNNPKKLTEDEQYFFKYIQEKFNNIPFCDRWISFPNSEKLLFNLLSKKIINDYKQLVEKNKGIVAQTEKTIYINEDKIETITA